VKIILLFQLALFLISLQCLAQPYGGTIFVDPDIITASDSSALVDVTYTGQGSRVVFDRRVNNWITINAFLFAVNWNDGLSSEAVINPEFETVALAEIEAEKYGWSIGQLPYCLRLDVNEIWINKGVELFGGGNNSILIHTGQTVLYENAGILEETLVHEAAHTSLDAMHAASPAWLEAQTLDGGFISDYAEEFPDREDIAESFLLWMAVRYREDNISTQDFNLITQAIPNRLIYFDEIVCDLFPFYLEGTTAVHEVDIEEEKIVVYPNPATDYIFLKHNDDHAFSATLFNTLGDVVVNTSWSTNQSIDLSELPHGLYLLVLDENGKQISRKIMKF
jgi:hypothetical protein